MSTGDATKIKDQAARRVVALEEAFLHPKVLERYPAPYAKLLGMVADRLMDVGPARLRRMDAAGIDLQVLSHVAPGVQTLERTLAITLAKEVNDWLANVVRTYPTRFAGFSTLPTQAPEEAAGELERTVREHGFRGAMINGHTDGRYLDDPFFAPILERAQELDVPIYIHPTDPPQAVTDVYYRDLPGMVTGGWGWQVETGTHLLRMICAGVFDRYPRLKIIVGHMGELIPYAMRRLNRALTLGNWILEAQDASGDAGMRKSVAHYIRESVFITTSGIFDHAPFECAVAELGIDRILFSVDDPFSDNFEAMEFLSSTRLTAADREKLAHGNADRLLRLSGDGQRRSAEKSIVDRTRSTMLSASARARSAMARRTLSFLVK